MNFKDYFGSAEWIGTGCDDDIPIIRDTFQAKAGERAEITVIGFGVFILYINGVRVHDTECLPLVSDFENSDYPKGEVLSHRVYPEVFDISGLLCEGENVISVELGNGWYNKPIWEEQHGDGRKKLAFRIKLGEGDSYREFISSHESATWVPSSVTFNHYNKGEERDLRIDDASVKLPCYKGELRPTVKECNLKDTRYMLSDCPRDRKIRELSVAVTFVCDEYTIYDFGINTTGYPLVLVEADAGEEVKIDFAEALCEDGTDLDELTVHEQRFNIIGSGKAERVRPKFGWIAARYAKVSGKAVPLSFDEVHAGIKPSSDFSCDNEVLNYLHRTFLHTQLTNMHTGIPSDCPQIERRGYTGDGQLVCHAAMLMTDSKAFYRKWLEDISDCQDRLTGHVQYTAPYTRAGGGTGGWGIAMIKVPYEYYLRFGDIEPMAKMYGQMHEYIRYMDERADCGFNWRDTEGEWCLGDWCAPGGAVVLPAPFVNSYFYVKACEMLIKIAEILGHTEDIAPLKERIEARRRITAIAYFNSNTGTAMSGVQGADAFSVDMGIGDSRTAEHFINKYDALGYYDTGIFGTDLVTRLLFELDRGDIAVRLMSAEEPHGYGRFMKRGATTLWEYWDQVSRSHSHPMFGAPCGYLYDYVLGIRQTEGSVGYRDVIINPRALGSVKVAEGYITNADGDRISVSYKVRGNKASFLINIPNGVRAVLEAKKSRAELRAGKNEITLEI